MNDAQPEPVRRAESPRVTDLLFAHADTHASRLAEEYLAERARWEAGREPERRRNVADLLAGRTEAQLRDAKPDVTVRIDRPVGSAALAAALGRYLFTYEIAGKPSS